MVLINQDEELQPEEVVVQIVPSKNDSDIHIVNQPIHLKFDNLCVRVDDKEILKNVSGEVKPGEILAIMGPSGAGKTTLLNFIAGRERGMSLESGEVTINNQKATKKLRRGTGFVMQEDVYFSHLTVKQTLQFVGEVRLPDSMEIHEKHGVVEDIISELGLDKCANTVMGGGFFVAGCSGGERKRCGIGAELITNPPLLIMDEPTSGLDSSTACNLIQTVKKLAQEENRAVITTIHQPSSHVFHMFDKLLLLCNGQVAYYGKINDVITFFEYIGRPCHQNWNPADFIMEQLTAGKEVEISICEKFDDFQRKKELHKTLTSKIREKKTPQNDMEDNETHVSITNDENAVKGVVVNNDNNSLQEDTALIGLKNPTVQTQNTLRWPTGFVTQTRALCKRAFIQSRKDLWDKWSFIQTMAIALLCGILWFDTPYDEDSLRDRQGVEKGTSQDVDVKNQVFSTLVYNMFTPMFLALMTFPTERNTIAKERAVGMYRLSAYFTAKCLSELPIVLFQPTLLYVIVYWMSGLNRSPIFLVGVLAVMTISLLAQEKGTSQDVDVRNQSAGLLIGACVKNFKKSITICVVYGLFCMLVAGFYTRRIPYWIEWMKYLSKLSHAYNIFMRMEFAYATREFKCSVESSFDKCALNGTYFLTGMDILPKVITIEVGLVESFVVLWSYIVLFRILFYLALRYLNKPK